MIREWADSCPPLLRVLLHLQANACLNHGAEAAEAHANHRKMNESMDEKVKAEKQKRKRLMAKFEKPRVQQRRTTYAELFAKEAWKMEMMQRQGYRHYFSAAQSPVRSVPSFPSTKLIAATRAARAIRASPYTKAQRRRIREGKASGAPAKSMAVLETILSRTRGVPR